MASSLRKKKLWSPILIQPGAIWFLGSTVLIGKATEIGLLKSPFMDLAWRPGGRAQVPAHISCRHWDLCKRTCFHVQPCCFSCRQSWGYQLLLTWGCWPPCSMPKSLPMILPEATTLAFSSSLNDSLSWINPLKSTVYPRVPGDSYMYVYTSSFSY